MDEKQTNPMVYQISTTVPLRIYIYIRIAINWGIILGRTTVNVAPVFMEILSGYHGIVVDLMSPAKYHEISAIESSTSRNSWAEYNNNI